MLSKYNDLENQISRLSKQLQSLPQGNLLCTRNGNHYKWYRNHNQSSTYLPKKERLLAEQLALRKYLILLIEDLSHEKRAIQFYLDHHSVSSKAERLLQNPAYEKLLASNFVPLSQELSDWMNSPYEKNTQHQEHLIHQGSHGKWVRSKSEAIIDMLLYTHKIPFRYECALQIGEIKLYPDFTIRHPKTGAVYYWEHFGLMDNSVYAQNAYSKLQLYTSHGIIPSIQLITTFETKENPINSDIVLKIIKHYFL